MEAGRVADRVIRLDLGCVPDPGDSGPLLLQDERRAYLLFNLPTLNPDDMAEPLRIALVELQGCRATRFGYPNDEALPGHPLYQQGLSYYGVFEVLESSWITQLEGQNRVRFPNSRPRTSRHFAFTFHDSTLECIADDLSLSITEEPFAQILQSVTWRFAQDRGHDVELDAPG
jgi:hypothetical protein